MTDSLDKKNDTKPNSKDLKETNPKESIDDNELDYGDETNKDKETSMESKTKIDVTSTEHKHKAVLKDDISLDKIKSKEKGTISLPSDFSDKLAELFTGLVRNHLEGSKKLEEWITVLRDGLNLTTNSEALCSTMDDPNSEWYQDVEVDNKNLSISNIQAKKSKEQSISGEKAVLLAMKHLDVGSIIQVPLWHTGIWITLITPKESSVIDLYRAIDDDVVMMGRSTSGLIYSNMSVIITKHVVSFIEDHIKNTSCNITHDVNLLDIISCNDLYPLVWGILCSMYPSGRAYKRACSNTECKHIEEARIDFRKIFWVDRLALTDANKQHMLNRRPSSMTVDEVLKYQANLEKTNSKTVTISSENGSTTDINLKVPSISKYLEYGEKWVNEISDMIEESVNTEITDKDKENYIQKYAQSSLLRQYSHWVKWMDIEGSIADTPETIDKVLTIYSRDSVAREEFIDNVSKFIDNSTVSLVGIPAYDCPVCSTVQENDTANKNFINVIPIDPILTFFTLTGQLMKEIAAR